MKPLKHWTTMVLYITACNAVLKYYDRLFSYLSRQIIQHCNIIATVQNIS